MSWTPLREPEADLTQLFALQLALSAASVVLLLWVLAVPLAAFALEYAVLVGACVVVAPLHELAHAAVFPRSRDAPSARVTFRPSRLQLYAQYDGVVSRARYLWMLGMPLLVLSVLPIVACTVLGHAQNDAVVLSLLNALVSGQDVLTIILVLAQVPAHGLVRRRRDATVWRAAREDEQSARENDSPRGVPIRESALGG